MEKLDLENYEVVALDGKEMRLSNGGMGAGQDMYGYRENMYNAAETAISYVVGFLHGVQSALGLE